MLRDCHKWWQVAFSFSRIGLAILTEKIVAVQIEMFPVGFVAMLVVGASESVMADTILAVQIEMFSVRFASMLVAASMSER